MNASVCSHAESFTDCFLYRVRPERENHYLSLAIFFLQLQRGLDSPGVEVVEVEFDARLVDRCSIGGDLEADVHVGYSLYAHGDLHRLFSHVKDFTNNTGTAVSGAV